MYDISILLVDDTQSKISSVISALEDIGVNKDLIKTAISATSAKKIMKEEHFDLLILDVALPLRDHGDPIPKGGLDLLDEIKERPFYRLPDHIIGLTAYQDIFESAGTQLGTELWLIVLFDPSSDSWVERIQSKIRHITRTKYETAKDNLVDVAIVCALRDPELDALLALPWTWTQEDVAGDATIYHKAEFLRKNGTTGKLVACNAPNMGMSSAAILAVKVALHYRPKCLVMIGICAGSEGKVSLGDIIVANPTWDYGSGKFSIKDGKRVFEGAQYQMPLTTRVRGIAERLQSDHSSLNIIKESFPGQRPNTSLKFHIGPLASGSAVVADDETFREIKEQHRKLLGIDMEAYGVMLAGEELPFTTETLVIKGVSDFANAKKDDNLRYYASYVSAQALRFMLENLEL